MPSRRCPDIDAAPASGEGGGADGQPEVLPELEQAIGRFSERYMAEVQSLSADLRQHEQPGRPATDTARLTITVPVVEWSTPGTGDESVPAPRLRQADAVSASARVGAPAIPAASVEPQAYPNRPAEPAARIAQARWWDEVREARWATPTLLAFLVLALALGFALVRGEERPATGGGSAQSAPAPEAADATSWVSQATVATHAAAAGSSAASTATGATAAAPLAAATVVAATAPAIQQPSPAAALTSAGAPIVGTPSAATVRQRVIAAGEALRTGQVHAAIDYGNGSRSSYIVRFDLREAGMPRLQTTITRSVEPQGQGQAGGEALEFIVVGDRAWQRKLGDQWAPLASRDGLHEQLQALLPQLAGPDVVDLALGQTPVERQDSSGMLTTLRWYDVGRNADMALYVDATSGVPREMRQTARSSGLTTMVFYRGWNTPVDITPPNVP